MQFSAEARWFFEGSVDPAMLRWFGHGDGSVEERRVDQYLVIPECDCAGVKVRGGDSGEGFRLEVKARIGDTAPIGFPGGVRGQAQRWSKWSVPSAAGAERTDGEHWVSLAKVRHLRKLAWIDGVVTEVVFDLRPDAGCVVELAEIEVSGRPYWTFGLETFGERQHMDAQLQGSGRWFFLDNPPVRPSLVAEASLPYPAWLASLP